MELQTVRVVYCNGNSMELEVSLRVDGLNVPARVQFESNNGQYSIIESDWMKRYGIDFRTLESMLLSHKMVRLRTVVGR